MIRRENPNQRSQRQGLALRCRPFGHLRIALALAARTPGPPVREAMAETDPPTPPIRDCSRDIRLERIEDILDAMLGRLSAQAVAVDLLLKALAANDRRSGVAVAMALEVAEADLLEQDGETETVRALRHIRERLSHALSPEDD